MWPVSSGSPLASEVTVNSSSGRGCLSASGMWEVGGDPLRRYGVWEASRRCRDFCYPVERENCTEHALRKMLKARARLGPGAAKPKRMRHETFVRLGNKYLAARREAAEALRERGLLQFERMEQERIKYDS